jgi:hypothetical protein
MVFEIEKPRIFHATRQQGTMIIETIRIIDTGLPGPFDQAYIIKAIDPFTSPKDRWMRRIEMLRELAYFVESDLLPKVEKRERIGTCYVCNLPMNMDIGCRTPECPNNCS